MSRSVPILIAFVLGALVSWWAVRPVAIDRRPALPGARELFREAKSASDGEIVVGLDEEIGVPPETATVPKSNPSAGQRRALARALDRLEKNPPEIAAANLDPETATTLRDKIRARLQGDRK